MEQSNVLDEYLEKLTSQIRCKKARGYIADEIRSHIEDQKEALIESGIEAEAAVQESIRQMGDPVSVGVDMDRIHRPGPDWKLLSFIALFAILGLFLQYHICAASVKYMDSVSQTPNLSAAFSPFFRQCLYTLSGLLCMAVIYFMDYTIIGKYPRLLWWLFTAFFLFCLVFGPRVNGAYPYARIYAFLFAPLFSGILYHARGGGIRKLLCCILYGLLASILTARGTCSFSTAAYLTSIWLLMVIIAVARGWFTVKNRPAILILTLVPILSCVLFLVLGFRLGWLADYQKARLMAFFHMIYEPQGISYISASIGQLMKSWTLFGSPSDHFFGYLPGYSFDYVLTYLFTFWGLVPGILILGTFILLFVRIFRSALRQPNCLGMMVGMSCGLVLTVQTISYLLSNLGYTLFTQLSLPFFSYGLNTTLITYILMGLLLSIYRYKDIVPEPQPRFYNQKNLL